MSRKKVVIILNGISLRKHSFYKKFLPALSAIADVEVKETLTQHDAIHLASKVTDHYPDAIIACGGDGTLNQVINGVLQGRETEQKLPAIGLIPMGSGNDFARTVNVKYDADHLGRLIEKFETKQLDLGEIQFTDFEAKIAKKYFINVADIGMGPVVVDKVNHSDRTFGHGLAYYKSILSTFASYRPMSVSVESDDWKWSGKLRSLAVGNGKFYGHGLCIAPDAIPDDQEFNVFICGNVTALQFVWHSQALKAAKHIRIPEIHYKTTKHLKLSSEERCLVEGDGEIFGTLPAEIKLAARRISFLV